MVVEVVGVVVVFPTVLALFLGVSPADPDVFPGALVLSDFAILFIHIFILVLLLFYTNFGPYKSYPLNRNLVLEICKERVYNHIVSEHMHK